MRSAAGKSRLHHRHLCRQNADNDAICLTSRTYVHDGPTGCAGHQARTRQCRIIKYRAIIQPALLGTQRQRSRSRSATDSDRQIESLSERGGVQQTRDNLEATVRRKRVVARIIAGKRHHAAHDEQHIPQLLANERSERSHAGSLAQVFRGHQAIP